MYETINSSVNYGGLELKNRIIFAPTTFGLSDEEYFEKIRKIAAGGCAMIIVGDVPVGKSTFEKSLFDKKGFAYYQKLARIVHQENCRICAQLHQSDSNMLAMLKYVPGVLSKKITMQQLRTLLNNEVSPYITKMSQHKIHKIIQGFGEAAVLTVKAGFDMVQVHGDRICGSFSSVIFNHRTDEYGGNARNRARFATEAVQAIRKRLPDLPIDYKLAVRQENPHYGNAGVLESELGIFIPLLEEAGVTSFHVTLANHSSLEDTIRITSDKSDTENSSRYCHCQHGSKLNECLGLEFLLYDQISNYHGHQCRNRCCYDRKDKGILKRLKSTVFKQIIKPFQRK